MIGVTLRVLSKVLVLVHYSSASAIRWDASCPLQQFSIVGDLPTLHPHSRRAEQGPGLRPLLVGLCNPLGRLVFVATVFDCGRSSESSSSLATC
jgi:hypothetical protein